MTAMESEDPVISRIGNFGRWQVVLDSIYTSHCIGCAFKTLIDCAGEENHDSELSGLVHSLANALRLLPSAQPALLVQPKPPEPCR